MFNYRFFYNSESESQIESTDCEGERLFVISSFGKSTTTKSPLSRIGGESMDFTNINNKKIHT